MQNDFKTAMRQWQSGICLVTALDQAGDPVGLVCNSFASLSLDPPLVGWSVDHGSSSIEGWRAADSYALHIFPPVTNPLDHPLIAVFAQRGGEKFAGLSYEMNDHGNPVFPELETRFDCVVHQRLIVGDHDLMIGRPTQIIHPGTPPAS